MNFVPVKISRLLKSLALLLLVNSTGAMAANGYVTGIKSKGSFSLSANGQSAPLYISESDFPGVKRALGNLQHDIAAVAGAQPQLATGKPVGGRVVLVGTIGKSPLIDGLIAQKKINVNGISGKWETYVLQTIANPMPGVAEALVIAGSDKRGTIYGIYDLSKQIGVSPWYWWADVPVKQQKALYIKPGRYTDGEPKVKYRGIFINDEAPAFSGWTKEKFGGVNSKMYTKMFELILRLKGNYLWPAMWGNAFNEDDPLNPVLADEYGVVMGTSHHEPMDRAQTEWKRHGTGEWNYQTNGQVLRDFWKQGIANMGNKETIVTVGMRGDGDMPMTEGSNIKLLEQIVADQRKIIGETLHKDVTTVPQMWALYKEVQDYYDKGMRVPDDVTLLLCDDNWGNIRKLPKLGEPKRKGGYGIYYHFDYVGDPRNYKWLNTNPIAKTWEQMHLAYEYDARQVWIVNVGDLKPMEFPISFFLDYAWNPEKIPADGLQKYTEQWAAEQFGPQHAVQIAAMISRYTKYNGRRKPELLDQNTYSLTDYREFETVVTDYNQLKTEAEKLNQSIPAGYKDAYYQLVLHPILACANLNELYYTTALNKWYARQGRAAANDMAEKVKTLYARDQQLSDYYNKTLAGGKWSHMMDQTHIGYTYWQQPEVNKMPEVTQISLPVNAQMGISLEGADQWWPDAKQDAVLPEFSRESKAPHYIDIFNRGQAAFNYSIHADAPWVHISQPKGRVQTQQRVWISIDWAKAPAGAGGFPVFVSGPNVNNQIVQGYFHRPIKTTLPDVFVENDRHIAIEAPHYAKAINTKNISWVTLPDHGRTGSAVTVMPVTAKVQQPGGDSPHLVYRINMADTGAVKVTAYLSPTIDFTGGSGLQYAISVDGEKPQLVNINTNQTKTWEKDVSDNVKQLVSTHQITKPGLHTINYWMVNPGVVLQKLVVDAGGAKPSYLGPPESYRTR